MIRSPWTDESENIQRGKKVCKESFGSNTDVKYQASWPKSAYPEVMTHDKYESLYPPKLQQQRIADELEDLPNELKIFVMTWNTESVNICGYIDNEWYGDKAKPLYYSNDPCYKSEEFFRRIRQLVISNDMVDIIVIGFQESAKPGDYMFSYSLPEYLKELGYVLVIRDRSIGIGLTTFTKGKARGLRSAVFVRRSIYEKVPIDVSSGFKDCPSFTAGGVEKYVSGLIRGKGGLQITLDIQGYGKYMFVNYHLPFLSKRLNPDYPGKKYLLDFQTECIVNTYKNFVKEIQPDYTFVFGDLNFRLHGLNEDEMFNNDGIIKSNKFPEWYENKDELYRHIGVISQADESRDDWIMAEAFRNEPVNKELQEGINNQGPNFAPTCKMMKGRDAGCTNRECYQATHSDGGTRLPSWCDRILYSRRNPDKPDVNTIAYNRIDEGSLMSCSDHAGVYAIFTVAKTGSNKSFTQKLG